MKALIVVVLLAGLGTVVATVWIGSGVREEQVVDQPYETGLRYDADRAARASLGWTARVEGSAAAGREPSPVRFALRDGTGAPLDGAEVTVAATRPQTSRDRVAGPARPLGEGRYEAALVFAGPGPWELAIDVRRGGDRLVLERPLAVRAAKAEEDGGPAGCDLAAAPCTRPLPGVGALTLELTPRPPRPFTDLAVTAVVRDASGRPIEGAEVAVRFEMPGMFMGELRAPLPPADGGGRHAGKAVLVRCRSGRTDWRAVVEVKVPGMAPATGTFDFRVTE